MMLKRWGRMAAFAAMIGTAALAGTGCRSTGGDMAKTPVAPAELTARIQKITYVSEANRTIVKIYGSRKFEYTSYKLAEPLRLAVEMPNAALDFEPRRINVTDRLLSGMSVVRFDKVNSVRLELELLSDAPFKLTQRTDFLEVILGEGGNAPAASAPRTSDAAAAGGVNGNELETLRAENENLKNESIEARKQSLALEEENQTLKKQVEEQTRLLEEANALSRSLQARVTFMEEQLSDIRAKMGDSSSSSSSSTKLSLGAAPVPVPAGGAGLPAPIAIPADDGAAANTQVKREVRDTLAAWLKAWRGKDIDGYSAFYASDFQSQNMGRNEWIADKTVKFSSNRKFKIGAEQLKIGVTGDTATAVFEQTYETGSYKDRGMKQLKLRKDGGTWLIVSEEWSPL